MPSSVLDPARGGEVVRANRTHSLVLARDHAPVGVELPQMVGEMNREMHQIVGRGDPDPSDGLGEIRSEIGCGEILEQVDRGARGLDLSKQLGPADIAPAKFGRPVAQVARAAKPGA
jgi:hypothetical protein